MKTHFEFTIEPTVKELFNFFSEILNEGYSNDQFSNFKAEHKSFLIEIKNKPKSIYKAEDYMLLNELALQIKFKWAQNKTIKIFFLDSDISVHKKVLEIISEWSKHCNISFDKTVDKNKSDLRVSFLGVGYWSYIGTNAMSAPKNEPNLNLQINNGIDINGNEFKRLTLHEFGHALGLVHEHQRPEAAIDWDKFYVSNFFKTNYNWTDDKIKHNLFDIVDKKELNGSKEVDRLSIMAYNVPKAFIKSGYDFPLNYTLSRIDKEHIGKLYPKNNTING